MFQGWFQVDWLDGMILQVDKTLLFTDLFLADDKIDSV